MFENYFFLSIEAILQILFQQVKIQSTIIHLEFSKSPLFVLESENITYHCTSVTIHVVGKESPH